ncbi:replication initiation protein [Vibrio palustris]|uniref:Initiator Replication protein n=1 Tax=Vibrio palustris TaxID=1918946 RepID=A0A1R4B7J0_9VIBR|nr:replication initiation protein [Vibrio palustris]SJL84884.1 Initiator Replication protein [Vibrio palustris]
MTHKMPPPINVIKIRNQTIDKSIFNNKSYKCKLSYNQYKILSYCISLLKHNENNIIKIDIKDYCQAIGLTLQSNNFIGIQNALKTLEQVPLVITNDTTSSPIPAITHVTSLSDNQIEVGLEQRYLAHLEDLTTSLNQYNFINIAFLTSYYSIHLYEICKSWQGRKTMIVDVVTLRQIFALENTLRSWQHFKERVLSKPLEEINLLTDINIEVEYIRHQRMVKKIKFTISTKTREQRIRVNQYIKKHMDSKYIKRQK